MYSPYPRYAIKSPLPNETVSHFRQRRYDWYDAAAQVGYSYSHEEQEEAIDAEIAQYLAEGKLIDDTAINAATSTSKRTFTVYPSNYISASSKNEYEFLVKRYDTNSLWGEIETVYAKSWQEAVDILNEDETVEWWQIVRD